MRLRRIIWRGFGTPPHWNEWHERARYKEWLENSGACVHAWMHEWECRW